MYRKTAIATALLSLLLGFSGSTVRADGPDVRSMLTDWVVDFRSDPSASVPVIFGVRVKDAEPSDWHVMVTGRKTPDSLWSVALVEGFPESPCAFFITDGAHLSRLYSGELAGLTAMGKAFSTDFAPLDLDTQEGFEPAPGDIDHLIRLSFHFWDRGFPEVVKFGDLASTRVLHGANATLFYYQEGFRSGWFSITKGQHVNADKASQTNPFPTLFIMTRGRTMSRIGGVEKEVAQGDALYIGPGVTHEFWNDAEDPAEGVLVMFGDGA